MVMPAPRRVFQSKGRDGKSRATGLLASRRKNSTNPISPAASSREDRTISILTPALAMKITLSARTPNVAKGNGGALLPTALAALGVASTA